MKACLIDINTFNFRFCFFCVWEGGYNCDGIWEVLEAMKQLCSFDFSPNVWGVIIVRGYIIVKVAVKVVALRFTVGGRGFRV